MSVLWTIASIKMKLPHLSITIIVLVSPESKAFMIYFMHAQIQYIREEIWKKSLDSGCGRSKSYLMSLQAVYKTFQMWKFNFHI